jgi:hypothetical protein
VVDGKCTRQRVKKGAKHADGSASYGAHADASASFGVRADGGASFGVRADGSASFGVRADASASFGVQARDASASYGVHACQRLLRCAVNPRAVLLVLPPACSRGRVSNVACGLWGVATVRGNRYDPEQKEVRLQHRGLKKVVKLLKKADEQLDKGYNRKVGPAISFECTF